MTDDHQCAIMDVAPYFFMSVENIETVYRSTKTYNSIISGPCISLRVFPEKLSKMLN